MSDRILVLGAGPSGLAAAYRLALAGRRPVVLERSNLVGGLMRSIQRNDFTLDIGCKELYSRLPEVHDLWSQILGQDYRNYPHRIGVLYQGRILELSTEFGGFRRGMPWSAFVLCSMDLLWNWTKPRRRL